MARPKYPSDEVDKALVRFPPGLRVRIYDVAKRNNRSMNAEIIARLEASFLEGPLSEPTLNYAASLVATVPPGEREQMADLIVQKLMKGLDEREAKQLEENPGLKKLPRPARRSEG